MKRVTAISQRETLGDLLAALKINYVLDVGANQGQYARLLRRVGYSGQILSFEPNPDVFQKLKLSFANDVAWRGFNCGLGSADGELNFNIFEESQVSSFLPANEQLHTKLLSTLKLPVRRLDAFVRNILPDWADHRFFLKCDTQGFDVEVLKGAEGVLTHVYGLQSEITVHALYRGTPRYLEALRFYESLGYVLVDLWLNNRTADGDVLEYDCIMRRKEL
jgi:FkbM family methyltransferase